MTDETGPWPIDELARMAGTTARNVRLYQTRGLLRPPDRKGRVGLYGVGHLRRLRLVLTFLQRGYPLDAIRELLEAWEANRSLGEVLGFEEALAAPFVSESPRAYSLAELQRLFPDDDGTNLQRAVDLGLLEPAATGYVAPIPALLDVGAQLVAEGIDLHAVVAASAEIQAASNRLADVFVKVFVDSVWQPFSEQEQTPEAWQQLTATLNRLRALWPNAVLPAIASAMQSKVDEATRAMAANDVATSVDDRAAS